MSWIVRDVSRDPTKEWEVDSRAEAEEKKSTAVELGASPESIEIVPPSQDIEPDVVDQTEETAADGGSQVVEEQPTPEEMEADPDIITGPEDLEQESTGGYDLPDKPRVDQDPLTWMPEEFTDTIDGSVAINRKGFEVLCQHFGVSVKPECQINPYETDFEYAQCRAVATDAEGTEYVAYGSAHVDRGDDPGQLLEMADTRSYKRAASRATGVGMLAVEEIQNGVSGQ